LARLESFLKISFRRKQKRALATLLLELEGSNHRF
jgi:hypothetical protein